MYCQKREAFAIEAVDESSEMMFLCHFCSQISYHYIEHLEEDGDMVLRRLIQKFEVGCANVLGSSVHNFISRGF